MRWYRNTSPTDEYGRYYHIIHLINQRSASQPSILKSASKNKATKGYFVYQTLPRNVLSRKYPTRGPRFDDASRFYISHSFKERNRHVSDGIFDCHRIKKAGFLLRTTNYSISQVADIVGFCSTFSKTIP